MDVLKNILSQEVVHKLGWTLLHSLWQGGVVVLLLVILLRVLRKSSANLRYVVACLGLAVIVLLPVVTFYVVPTPPDVESVPGFSTPITEKLYEVYDADIPLQRAAEYMQVFPAISWKQRAMNIYTSTLPYIVLGWLVGVIALCLWHLGGWAHLQRLRRQKVNLVDESLKGKLRNLAERLKVTRPVKIMESVLVQIPTVVGWLRPMILMPASALAGLSPEQVEALIAHELAHIRRYDYLVNMFQTLVEVLGFYHPAVWWISYTIRVERENCCDDLAVSVCGDKVGYARALTSMEEARLSHSELAVAASGGNLSRRIRRLIGAGSEKNIRFGYVPVVISILLIVALMIPTTLALTAKRENADSNPNSTAESDSIKTSDVYIAATDQMNDYELYPVVDLDETAAKAQILFDCKIYELSADLEIIEGRQEEKPPKGRNVWLGSEYAERLESLCRKSKKAKILANPRILVLEGEEANMVIGNEIPYKAGYESTTEGGTEPKPIFKYLSGGIDLKLKGNTVDNSTISTEIRLTQSKTSLTTHKDSQGREIQIPVVASSVCTTDITVPSQTPVVIGGLKSQGNDNRQLLFVITPSIMNPEKGIESQVTIVKERRTVDDDFGHVVEFPDAEKEQIKADQRLAKSQRLLEQDQDRKKALEDQALELQQKLYEIQMKLEELDTRKAELKSLSVVYVLPKKAESGEELRYHTVREGETLSSISEKYYGSENKWQKILDYNRDIITADGIRVGQQLIMPPFQVSAKEPESEHERFAVTAAGFAICDDYAKAIEHIEKAIELAKAGKYYGIGIAIEKVNGLIRIVQVLPDTPASGSSFRPGDIIKAIDGLSTESMSLNEVVAKIVGPEGTKVTLTVKSHNQDITMKETFTRQLSLTDSPAIEEYQRRFDTYKAAKTGDEYLKTMQRQTASIAGAPRIFELKYAGAVELAEVLSRVLDRRWKGMSDKPAQVVKIVPDSRTKRLIILASPADIRLIEALIAELDISPPKDGTDLIITSRIEPKSDSSAEGTITQIIKLQYADCGSVEQILIRILSNEHLKIATDERTNMLIVAATESTIQQIKDLVAEIDVPVSKKELKIAEP